MQGIEVLGYTKPSMKVGGQQINKAKTLPGLTETNTPSILINVTDPQGLASFMASQNMSYGGTTGTSENHVNIEAGDVVTFEVVGKQPDNGANVQQVTNVFKNVTAEEKATIKANYSDKQNWNTRAPLEINAAL